MVLSPSPPPPSRFYFVYSLRGVWTELSADKLTKDITSLKIASEPGLTESSLRFWSLSDIFAVM